MPLAGPNIASNVRSSVMSKNGVAEFTPTEANLILIVVHHQEHKRSGEGYDSTYYSSTLTVAVPEVP